MLRSFAKLAPRQFQISAASPLVRHFTLFGSSRSPPPRSSQVRVYDPVRTENEFHTLLLLTTTHDLPLVTVWTASYVPSCPGVVSRVLEELRASNLPSAFAEVEADAQGGSMEELVERWIFPFSKPTNIPTLAAFWRGDLLHTLTVRGDNEFLADRSKIQAWIEEVRRETTRFPDP